MAHNPSQFVPFGSAPQFSTNPLPHTEDEYTRNNVHLYADEEPYSDPVMYAVNPAGTSASVTPQSLNNGYSGHVQTSSHYAPGLPASWVTPGMTHTIILSAPVVHVTPSSSPPAPSSAQATTNGPRRTQKEENLIQLEQDIISSAWYAANDLEPACGDLDCPYHADAYGIRGMSCYTAFVDTKPDGTFGCWREQCSSYSRRKLDDAVKHQRTNHFNHKPFVCTPTNGTTCGKRFFSPADLQNHRRRSSH